MVIYFCSLCGRQIFADWLQCDGESDENLPYPIDAYGIGIRLGPNNHRAACLVEHTTHHLCLICARGLREMKF